MRREIETAPKNGKPIILEDDAGIYELGRWSPEKRAWVGEDDKPIAITPAYWLPLQQRNACLESHNHLPQNIRLGDERSDHSIQPVVPLTNQAVLTRPPDWEDVFSLQNNSVWAEAPMAADRSEPLRWSCQDNEHLPQGKVEDRSVPDFRNSPIGPCSTHSALEQLAQTDVFALPKNVTLPMTDAWEATTAATPILNYSAQSDERCPSKGPEWDALPDPLIQPILPLTPDPAPRKSSAKENASRQDFVFPVVEPRTASNRSRAHLWRRRAFPLATAALMLALVVIYFQAPVAVTQYTQRDPERIFKVGEPSVQSAISFPIQWLGDRLRRAPAVQEDNVSVSGEPTATRDAVQGQPQFNDATLVQQPQALDGQKTTVLLQDLAAAQQRLTENEVRYGKLLTEERERSVTLTSELAAAQRAVETQVSRSNKSANESAQLKLAVDAAAAKLQRERERADALASELEKMRRQVEIAAADEAAGSVKMTSGRATSESQRSEPVRLPSLPRYVQSPQSVGWTVYRGQGGAVVDVPLGIFKQDVGPTAKGTGRRFRSADGRSEFAAYSFREPGQTPESYLRNNLAIDPATISYKRITNRFFALSSESGGRIYYSRCNFYDAIHCIYLEYPQSEKVAWDAIVTRISLSLRRGS